MSRRISATSKESEKKGNDVQWKERVRELEGEVSSLKRRLDELRKAKNTTLLKNEKTYVNVAEPNIGKHPTRSDDKVSDLQKQIQQLKLKHSKEIEDLKKKSSQEPSKTQEDKELEDCGHEPVIEELSTKCQVFEREKEELGYLNDALGKENKELREKYEQLLTELSIKEAQWCEKEEELKMKLKLQWGEKYRQWMEQTEQKISELQRVNDFLREKLRSEVPKDN
ncbi:centrosomal protein of 128 kDa-like [Ptychodera flava]|uniref:centrosomal protein of 128 kDa-like n=1 Tax=Ptychodera flava TaxID=63121 RepID=UPI003969F1C1